MSMANRDQAIIDFQEKSGVNILIVSLKAAALGLNLVAANHVVLLDLVSSLFIRSVCSDLSMMLRDSPHICRAACPAAHSKPWLLLSQLSQHGNAHKHDQPVSSDLQSCP